MILTRRASLFTSDAVAVIASFPLTNLCLKKCSISEALMTELLRSLPGLTKLGLHETLPLDSPVCRSLPPALTSIDSDMLLEFRSPTVTSLELLWSNAASPDSRDRLTRDALPALTSLRLAGWLLRNELISAICQLPLKSLELFCCQIHQLSAPLSGLRQIETLNLIDSGYVAPAGFVDSIADLPALRSLKLSQLAPLCTLRLLPRLASAGKLTHLDLRVKTNEEIRAVSTISTLKSLKLGLCCSLDASSFNKFPDLKALRTVTIRQHSCQWHPGPRQFELINDDQAGIKVQQRFSNLTSDSDSESES